ncbi:MAG: histidine kinase [Candidatus Sulfotelmatobacter sp.]|jgi:PAS domain S-box-containing protein
MENDIRKNADLHLMEEAEETLQAISVGAVDAFVLRDRDGHRVHMLSGSDLPYSTLVERMQQGAAMLDATCHIMYSNNSLANLLGVSREALAGFPLTNFIAPADKPICEKLLSEVHVAPGECEVRLLRSDGTLVPTHFAFNLLSRDKSTIGVLITDLTARNDQIELASRFQHMQDDERKRIARELHDSVGQLLAAIGMNLAVIQSQSHKLDTDAERALSENAQLVEEVSREIRTISHLLHPPLLDMAGLASAVRWYVDGFSERSKIKVNLEIPADFGRLPDDVEIAVFRLVQECLTNIHRHSGSAVASIGLCKENDHLIIKVSDEGKGISKEKQQELLVGRSGIGFGGMRERVRQLDGSLDIQSDESGTTVIAKLKVS